MGMSDGELLGAPRSLLWAQGLDEAVIAKGEWIRCQEDVAYFGDHFVRVFDATSQSWLRFHLWRMQRCALRVMDENRLVVILKARQLGLSWLAVADALHTL